MMCMFPGAKCAEPSLTQPGKNMQGFEKRLLAAYASLVVIGLGSVMFHATLRYEMQGRKMGQTACCPYANG